MKSVSEQIHATRNQLIEKAANFAIPCNDQTLQEFAGQLRNMDQFRYVDEAVASLPHLRVPEGFSHVKYTAYPVKGRGRHGELILDEGRYAGASIQAELLRLSVDKVICTGMVLSDLMDATIMGPARWIETFALPVKQPGVLELGLVLEPFEQNDGSFDARIKVAARLARENPRQDDVRPSASAPTDGQP